MTRARGARLLLFAWLMAYVVLMVGAPMLKPGYSSVSQYVSELGATGTPAAAIVNLVGFMAVGALFALVLFVLRPMLDLRGAARVGYWLLLAEPAAYIGSALAPCDLGCPMPGSPLQQVHNLLGLITYSTTGIGILLLGLAPQLKRSVRSGFFLLCVAWLLLFGAMADPQQHAWRGALQRGAEFMLYGALWLVAWRVSRAPAGASVRNTAAPPATQSSQSRGL